MWRSDNWKEIIGKLEDSKLADPHQEAFQGYCEGLEAGADAQGEAILKLCEELQDGVKDSECFRYGGPTNCEYRCLPGLIEILRGKQCSGAER